MNKMEIAIEDALRNKEEFELEYLDIDERITAADVPYLKEALKEKGITTFTNSYFGCEGCSLVATLYRCGKEGIRMKETVIMPDYKYNRSLSIPQDDPQAFKKMALLFEVER